jgi:hypothetical protein
MNRESLRATVILVALTSVLGLCLMLIIMRLYTQDSTIVET